MLTEINRSKFKRLSNKRFQAGFAVAELTAARYHN